MCLQKFFRCPSLFYESERLATFIEWPLSYILPKDLAANGFYYLRTSDYCACIFCKKVIGGLKITDNYKHFPSCPFLKEKAILGNIPMEHCQILEGLVLDGEERIIPSSIATTTYTTTTSISTTTTTTTTSAAAVNDLCLTKYSKPAKKEFITGKSRLQSFTSNGREWPERLVQKPEELVDAGFFYNG